MTDNRFLRCEICGNIIGMIFDAGIPMMCCGEEMTPLKANSVDASQEKHVPDVIVDGSEVKVKIGSAPHPMEKVHYIEWVYVQTENGGQRKALQPGMDPELSFALADDKAKAVFAYCNLHGLWVKEL
jgi:superoxide reductase